MGKKYVIPGTCALCGCVPGTVSRPLKPAERRELLDRGYKLDKNVHGDDIASPPKDGRDFNDALAHYHRAVCAPLGYPTWHSWVLNFDLPDPEPPLAQPVEFAQTVWLVMWNDPIEKRRSTEIYASEEVARDALTYMTERYGPEANAVLVWQEWRQRVTPHNAWDKILYHHTFDTDDTVTT